MTSYADVNALHSVLSDYEFRSLGNADNINRCLRLATIKIDEVTFNRIKGAGLENLTPFQQGCVREACCYQALKINADGFDDGNVQSYSVGDISITEGQNGADVKRQGLCAEAFSLLSQSGLMQRVI